MSRRSRRLAATLCTLVAVSSGGAAGFLGLNSTAARDPSVVAPAPNTAVLSPRRAPAALRDLIANTRLAGRLDSFMNTIAPTSCLTIVRDQFSVYSLRPNQPLIPASTLKLTTAAAFLAKVGGKGTFSTTVRGAAPDRAGTVDGDLTLIGGGDPLLSTAGYVATRKHPPDPATDFTALASRTVAAGVRRVTGGIAVNDARYDAERRVPSWKPGYTTAGDVGPLGALAVDDGFAAYTPRLIAAPDPAIAAGEAFRKLLNGLGVVVDGPTTRVSSRGATELASVDSAPFASVVGEMLRESDNNSAELLLKELAHASGTVPSTRRAGAAARVTALQALGLPSDQIQAIDGSGLDRSDRATCAALQVTLTARPGGYDIEDMLAVAGRTGTLNDRFTTSPLAGRLRAKTGSLDDVTALVGVTDPAARSPLRFAFVANGPFSDAGGKALQDRLVSELATYPEAPEADALAP